MCLFLYYNFTSFKKKKKTIFYASASHSVQAKFLFKNIFIQTDFDADGPITRTSSGRRELYDTRHICCCGTGKEKETAKCWIGDKDRLCCPKQSTGISSGKEKSRIEENLEPAKQWEDKGVRENCNVNVSTISWEGPYFSFLWCRYIFIWFKALSEVLHIHSLSVLLGFVSA